MNLVPSCSSVQIHLSLALVAPLGSPEQLVAAAWANITGLLILHPLVSSYAAPVRNGPQDDSFAHGHGEMLDQLTGEISALVAAGIALLGGAVFDIAFFAVNKRLLGEASLAVDILHAKALASCKPALIKVHELFFEFQVVFPCRVKNSAHATVKATGSQEIRIDLHEKPPDDKLLKTAFSVIPATAGIQSFQSLTDDRSFPPQGEASLNRSDHLEDSMRDR